MTPQERERQQVELIRAYLASGPPPTVDQPPAAPSAVVAMRTRSEGGWQVRRHGEPTITYAALRARLERDRANGVDVSPRCLRSA
jgi:hypothetical protein